MSSSRSSKHAWPLGLLTLLCACGASAAEETDGRDDTSTGEATATDEPAGATTRGPDEPTGSSGATTMTTTEGSDDSSSGGGNDTDGPPPPGDASGVRVKPFVSHVATAADATSVRVWFVAERPRGDISAHGGFNARVVASDGFRGAGRYEPLDEVIYFAPGERYASVDVELRPDAIDGLTQVVLTISEPDGDAVVHSPELAFTYVDIAPSTIPDDALHVSPNASDGDGSLASPWSLPQAFALAAPGDLVILAGGTYTGDSITGDQNNESPVDGFEVEVDGTSEAQRIVFMGAPGEAAIVDQAGQHNGIYLEGRRFITLRNLEIRNIENPGGPSAGIYVATGETSEHINIEHVYSHAIVGAQGSNTASFKLQNVDGARIWASRGEDVTLQGEANGNCAVVHSYGMRGVWIDRSELGPTGGTGNGGGSGLFHKRDDTPDWPDVVVSRTFIHDNHTPVRFGIQGGGNDIHDLEWLHNNVVVDGGLGGMTLADPDGGGVGTDNIGRNNTYVGLGASELGTLNTAHDMQWQEQNSIVANTNRAYSSNRGSLSDDFAGTDFNILYGLSSDVSTSELYLPGEVSYATLREHQAGTGLDTNSLDIDPQLNANHVAQAGMATSGGIDGLGIGAHAGPEGPTSVQVGAP